MEDLNEDVINEILLRLPPKKALQCRSLNKSFLNRISDPSFARRNAVASSSRHSTVFHCSFHDRRIFTEVDLETNNNKPTTSVSTSGVSILASCNGVLLLQHTQSPRQYVFNPITGGMIPVAGDSFEGHDDVGLATPVDFHQFKLVALGAAPPDNNDTGTALRFVVVVPVGDSTVVKSRVDFACRGFTRAADYSMRTVVYAHGALHWLGECGTRMVAFDVEKEEARMINGPLKNIDGPRQFLPGVDKWFGVARGSLTFIYTLQHEIVVHSHDHYRRGWRVQYRIANISNPTNNHYRNGLPVFFDGVRLFLKLWKRGEDGQIYMKDLLSGQWEKKGIVGGWSDACQVFTAFVPTLAKVSHDYTLDKVLPKVPHRNYYNLDEIFQAWVKKDFQILQNLIRKCCT